MSKVNVSNLQSIVTNLQSHVVALADKDVSNQGAVDALADTANNLDTAVVAIVNTPDPGPRTDLSFALLDGAVETFKKNRTISQNDTDHVAQLITQNTPQ